MSETHTALRRTLAVMLVLASTHSAVAPAAAQDTPAVRVESRTAQPTASARVQTLTLRDALTRASRSAPQVLAAFARADAARAQLRVASSALYPTLSANVSANLGIVNGGGGTITTLPGGVSGGGGSGVSVTATGAAALNANWTIWDFGRTSASSNVARGNETIADADGASVQQAAIQTAAAAFYGVLADERVVEAARTTVAQRTTQRDIAAGLVEVGSRAPIERIRAEVALASAELDLRVAEGALRSDTATLAAALALDPARALRVIEPELLSAEADPGLAAAAALRARPDVRAERARVQTFEAQVRGARAAYLPTLSASASASARYIVRGTGDGTASETVSASVVLSAPLLDLATPARVSAAEAQLIAARETLAALELDVRTNAVQSAIAVRNAEIVYEQAARLAEGTAANLAQAEGRYAAGAAAQLELIDAQAEDANARITVIRLRAQLEQSKIALLAVLGRLPELTRR